MCVTDHVAVTAQLKRMCVSFGQAHLDAILERICTGQPGAQSNVGTSMQQLAGAHSAQHQHKEPLRQPSDEGISHFDDEAQSSPGGQQVGHDSMSTFQASLPVGVSMTHDSTQ